MAPCGAWAISSSAPAATKAIKGRFGWCDQSSPTKAAGRHNRGWGAEVAAGAAEETGWRGRGEGAGVGGGGGDGGGHGGAGDGNGRRGRGCCGGGDGG